MEDIIQLYQNPEQLRQQGRKSSCLPDVFQAYMNTRISKSQALRLALEPDAWESDIEPDLLVVIAVKRFADNNELLPVEGYYYPVRLGDTYGLLLDCSVNNQTELQPTESFAYLKAEIEQKRLKSFA